MNNQMGQNELWIGGYEKGASFDCVRDVILPDLYRDVKKILWYSGSLHPETVYMENGRAGYEGVLSCTILFVDEEDKTKCMKTTLDYQGSMQVSVDSAHTRLISLPRLENLSIKALNPRKLAVRAKISPEIRYWSAKNTEPTYPDFFGESELSGIESRRLTLEQSVPCSLWERGMTLSEDVSIDKSLPSIDEMLYATATVEPTSVRAGDGVISVEGVATIEYAYLADDGQIVFDSKNLPIDQVCRIDGADGGSDVLAEMYVGSIECTPSEDISGQYRMLGIELTYDICAFCLVSVPTEYVADLYSTGYVTENRCEDYSCAVERRTFGKTLSGKAVTECSEGGEPARAYGVVNGCSVTNKEDQTSMRISLSLTALIHCADGRLTAVPLSDSVECSLPVCSELMYIPRVENVNARLEAGTLSVSYDVRVSALCWDSRRITAVTSVSSSEGERITAARPLTVYYPLPGENMWQIAKKYRISRVSLDAANRSREQGEAMIIPRREKSV